MALKEKALKRLAEKLDARGVAWAAGGAWARCQRGQAETYHRFDIYVAEADAAAADAALSRLGLRSPISEAPFRCAYHFDGADVTLTALPALATDGEATALGAAVPLLAPALEGEEKA